MHIDPSLFLHFMEWASGYMARNKYVDGCWLGVDGAWVK